MGIDFDTARREIRELAAEVPAVPGRIRLEASALIIDNPSARGAMSAQMMVQLADAVAHLAQSPYGLVTLEGSSPGVFCSGGHLKQVRASLVEGDRGLRMSRCMTAILDELASLPCLVVARVDGPALGGGAELLTACDAVFVGDAAQIGFVHTQLGVVPGWGGTARLVRALGPRRACGLLGAGSRLDGPGAIAAGLAQGDLLAGVDWCDQVAAAPPSAVRAMKRQVLDASPIHRTEAESELFASVWGAPEHRARLGL